MGRWMGCKLPASLKNESVTRAGAPRIVEWYRVDSIARIRHVLLRGPVALTSGGLVVAVSFLTRQGQDVRIAAAAAGFVLIAGGAVYTILSMQRILRDDVCLTIRTDGVAIQSAAVETIIRWSDLTSAEWDVARQELTLGRRDGGSVSIARPFAGISGAALAIRIAGAKRKSEMNLLR
jgi:hypothetical protein